MATPEGKVKDDIKKVLKKHNCYWHMPVQSGYGAPALDFWVCAYGFFVGIEAKAEGKKPTARQEVVMQDVTAAEGLAVCIAGRDEVGRLDKLLNTLKRIRDTL